MSPVQLVAFFLALTIATGNGLKCLSCQSLTYLDPAFTNIDSEEDVDCVEGNHTLEDQFDCLPGASCFVTEGTVTWFVKGYGFVDAKMTRRSCVQLIGGSFPPGGCFGSHQSYLYLKELIGNNYEGRELTNFNGTFCGCHRDSCNNQQGSAPVITRGHLPKTNPRGLQCISCYHQVFQDPFYQTLDEPNPSCSEAVIESDSVYYHTCATGGVCGVIEGQIKYVGVNITYFGRDCMYGITDYPTTERTDGLLCVSSQTASHIVTSHLFSDVESGDADFSGDLCYCSTDFCELPQKVFNALGTDNHSNVNAIHFATVILGNALYGIIVLLR